MNLINPNDQSASYNLLHELLLALVFWGVVGAIITFLVNRRRQTSGWAKASLFLAILGMTTFIPSLLAIPTGHLALRQIRQSGGLLKGKVQAVFGLVCGYAVVLLGIGMIIFGFNYLAGEYQKHRSIEANIRVIENAKALWAAANSEEPQDTPTASELAPFMPGGQFPPTSIAGEQYEIHALGREASVVPPPPEY